MSIQSVARLTFLIGALPLLALTFFSPGLQIGYPLGFAIFGFGLLTLILLVMSPNRRRGDTAFIVLQLVLLALVVYETLSGGRLYIGT
jgi:hypothetical protein